VGAIAFDAQADDARAERLDTFLVLTEPIELEGSNTAKIEQVPGDDDWATGQVLGEGHGLAGRGRQSEERRAIANRQTVLWDHGYSVPHCRFIRAEGTGRTSQQFPSFAWVR
jgi:hypothetical protein